MYIPKESLKGMSYQEIEVEIFEDVKIQSDLNIIVPKWQSVQLSPLPRVYR